jgi:hypothetical protein
VLAALDPATSVSTEGHAVVAGRSAYELVLKPKDTASLVAQVRIALDGQTHVPTQVKVFAKGHPDQAAFEIAFTQVRFQRPDAGVFEFRPPPGVKVTEADQAVDAQQKAHQEHADLAAKTRSAVLGTGWTSVYAARFPQQPADAPKATGKRDQRDTLQMFLDTLPKVSGSWGSGRLVTSRLFSVLLTDDGRILVGAVSGDRLTAAAGEPGAALK